MPKPIANLSKAARQLPISPSSYATAAAAAAMGARQPPEPSPGQSSTPPSLPQHAGTSSAKLAFKHLNQNTNMPGPVAGASRPQPSLVLSSLSGFSDKLPVGVGRRRRVGGQPMQFQPYSTKAQEPGDFDSTSVIFDDQEGKEQNLIVMVDSGLGGGLTTAQIDGAVRQFGHYDCLPIGDKGKNSNINYTASMIAVPWMTALKEGSRSDGRVADGVIIACNSASVNMEPAIEVVTAMAHEIATDPDKFDIPKTMKTNAVALSALLKKDPDYLRNSVRGIIDATTDRMTTDIADALKSRDTHFLRIDSTNSTANSMLYPKQLTDKVQRTMKEQGYKLSSENSLGHADLKPHKVKMGDDVYNITHTLLHFEPESGVGGPKKVFIEGRGNPPWVPIVEGNQVNEKGMRAAEDSFAASKQAALLLPSEQAGAQVVFSGPPHQSANCCTHYDAMTKAIKASYGWNRQAEAKGTTGTMLSQSDVVKTLFKQMGGKPGEASGHQLTITRGVRADRDERDISANFAQGVINDIRQEKGKNTESRVEVKNLTPTQQDGFKTIVRLIAAGSDYKIGDDHGYDFAGAINRDGTLAVADVTAKAAGMDNLVHSNPSHRAVALSPAAAERVDALDKLIGKGEDRGIPFIKWATDGNALLNATQHLKAVVTFNKAAAKLEQSTLGSEQEHVGILTGFTVVDPKGNPLGGENDGPPGAVMMAKKLVEHDTPVALMTDKSALPSLLAALEGSNLASLKPGSSEVPARERGVHDFVLSKGVKVLVHDEGKQKGKELLDEALSLRMRTLITIERPAPNRAGKMSNMLGADISAHNADMSYIAKGLQAKGAFTISIGDGGNELGMGPVASLVSDVRRPNNDPGVRNGPNIAVSTDFKPDALVISSVSNNGGVAVAMALDVAMDATRVTHERTINDYTEVLENMAQGGMSLDGVHKEPEGKALSVDGRPLGSLEEARENPAELGSTEATHGHMFAQMIDTVAPQEGDAVRRAA